MAPAFGTDGLKVDDAREAVRLMRAPPVSGERGVVLVGLDGATLRTQDVLLKTLEEADGSVMIMVLWATDLGNVAETVRSRCFLYWQNAPEKEPELSTAGVVILKHLDKGHLAELVEVLQSHKGDELALLDALAYHLSTDPERSDLWVRCRPVFERRNPTYMEVLAALTGAL